MATRTRSENDVDNLKNCQKSDKRQWWWQLCVHFVFFGEWKWRRASQLFKMEMFTIEKLSNRFFFLCFVSFHRKLLSHVVNGNEVNAVAMSSSIFPSDLIWFWQHCMWHRRAAFTPENIWFCILHLTDSNYIILRRCSLKLISFWRWDVKIIHEIVLNWVKKEKDGRVNESCENEQRNERQKSFLCFARAT